MTFLVILGEIIRGPEAQVHFGEARMALETNRLNNRGQINDKARFPKDRVRIISSHSRIVSSSISNGPNKQLGSHKLNKFQLSSEPSNNNNSKIIIIRSLFNKMMRKMSLKF